VKCDINNSFCNVGYCRIVIKIGGCRCDFGVVR
jgi:hypothetical protein